MCDGWACCGNSRNKWDLWSQQGGQAGKTTNGSQPESVDDAKATLVSAEALCRHKEAAYGAPSLMAYALLDLPGEAGRGRPRAVHMPPNTPEAVAIESENFDGSVLWMQRPPDAPADSKFPYWQHFSGRQRQWEARIQGRFKRLPKGNMFIGLVLRDFDYNQAVAAHSRMVQRAGMMLVSRDYDLYVSWGARCKNASVPDAELSHLVTNMTGWDQIIVTPEGETPPNITEDLNGVGIDRKTLGRNKYSDAVKEISISINETNTYTFCFWGVSPFLSAVNWNIRCPAFTVNMAQFLEGWPIHCVMYELDPSAEKDKTTSKPIHRESFKRYYLDLVFWSNSVDCAPNLQRRYAFLDAPAHLEEAAGSSAKRFAAEFKRQVRRSSSTFSGQAADKPSGWLQEALSASLMLLPVAYTLNFVGTPDFAGLLEHQMYAWACIAVMVLQIPFLLAYHGVCAMNSCGKSLDDTPWRCLVQTIVHVGCTLGGLALSKSVSYAFGIVLPYNVYAVGVLWYRAKEEARHMRFVRMAIACAWFLLPLAYYGEWRNFFGSTSSLLLCSIFFVNDHRLGGWGQGLFYLLLVPFAHFVFTGMFS